MNFVGLLEQFAVADNETRKIAEGQLANSMNTNFPEFVTQMLQVLVNNTNPDPIRQMAGTLFKRAISSLTGHYLEEKQSLWRAMGDSLRSEIKMALLSCLSDVSFAVRNAAASAISAIARIEIPVDMWNDVFDVFRDVVQNPGTSNECRSACVETVRYICEDLQEYQFSDQMSSSVILLLLSCIHANQTDAVWQEAVQALTSALTFADHFMENNSQCSCVMEAVYNSLQHSNDEIQCHAFECLDTLFYVYYEKLSPYFSGFFDVCKSILQGSNPSTGIQSCLTLVTLAQVEKERMDANEQIFGFCSSCGPTLIPILCEVMTHKDEDDDSEIMTLPTASATCLQCFAEVMKDDLASIVWPFVTQNISSSNWNLKEAAVMTFGCMIHGPSLSILSTIIHEGTALLIDMVLHDASVSVRDSAAWVLSQICDGFLSEVPGDQTIALLECLITALDMEPRVAHHAALALSLICDYVANSPNSQILLPYYNTLLEKLFNTSEKTGAANTQLRETASYALISLINSRVQDTDALLVSFYNFVVQKCQATLNVQGDNEIIYSYQRFYCIALVSLLERLKEVYNPDIQPLIRIAFTILASNNTSTHTQALLLYDAVLVNVGVSSLEFVEEIVPHVVKAIKTPNDIPTCNAAITCLSDLLFIIDQSDEDYVQKQNCYGKILHYRDEILQSILDSIDSPSVNREIKPSLFSCLSCFFWIIPDFCIAFIPKCLSASIAASNYTIDYFDEDTVEWVNRLYASIVEFWDSLSAAQSRNPPVIREAIPVFLSFVGRVLSYNYIDVQLYKNCVLMLRDIGIQLKNGEAKTIIARQEFMALLEKCCSVGGEFQEVANEAYTALSNPQGNNYTSW